MKNTNEKSLRSQVEKWLAPAPAIPVHVIEFGRTRRGGSRYVCVETAGGARALFFFGTAMVDGACSLLPRTGGGRSVDRQTRPTPGLPCMKIGDFKGARQNRRIPATGEMWGSLRYLKRFSRLPLDARRRSVQEGPLPFRLVERREAHASNRDS
jgi:hypothetical protein